MLEILLWIVFGGIVGWIASIVAGTNREQGAIANIILGIMGALLGGFIARSFGSEGVSGFNLTSFVVAIFGAVILTWLTKFMRHSP